VGESPQEQPMEEPLDTASQLEVDIEAVMQEHGIGR